MHTSRVFFISIILSAMFVASGPGSAGAFWGFGSDGGEKSGLDFDAGYDVNTVTTVSGRVVGDPRPGEGGTTVIEVKAGSESVYLGVGPASFWQSSGITVNPDDEITARGSKAVGKDGKTYLLARKLVNKTTGNQLDLRTEAGHGMWMSPGQARSDRHMQPMNRGIMRGPAGMMRGGGGMRR